MQPSSPVLLSPSPIVTKEVAPLNAAKSVLTRLSSYRLMDFPVFSETVAISLVLTELLKRRMVNNVSVEPSDVQSYHKLAGHVEAASQVMSSLTHTNMAASIQCTIDFLKLRTSLNKTTKIAIGAFIILLSIIWNLKQYKWSVRRVNTDLDQMKRKLQLEALNPLPSHLLDKDEADTIPQRRVFSNYQWIMDRNGVDNTRKKDVYFQRRAKLFYETQNELFQSKEILPTDSRYSSVVCRLVVLKEWQNIQQNDTIKTPMTEAYFARIAGLPPFASYHNNQVQPIFSEAQMQTIRSALITDQLNGKDYLADPSTSINLTINEVVKGIKGIAETLHLSYHLLDQDQPKEKFLKRLFYERFQF